MNGDAPPARLFECVLKETDGAALAKAAILGEHYVSLLKICLDGFC